MRKRILLLGAAIGALFIGLAGFAANTAEWVNVVAHVEKEIELACVDANGNATLAMPDAKIPTGVGDCNFGTSFPEEARTMHVELTLSRSFLAQDRTDVVAYDILWECKLPDPSVPFGTLGDFNGDGVDEVNICRENLDNVDNVLKLDGNIRDFVKVYHGGILAGTATSDNCFRGQTTPGSGFAEGGNAELDFLDRGVFNTAIDQVKCVYELRFTVPACEGHWNPNTDPGTDPTDVACQDNIDEANPGDPQLWEHWADLGDDFKIQVWGLTDETD